MKLKFNWSFGIILSLIFFMGFVIYITFFFPHPKSELISDKYYEEEIKYQEIINEKKNVLMLPENKRTKIIILSSGIGIVFPYFSKDIYGFFTLLRFSSKNLDITKYFQKSKYSKKILFIPKKFLKKGHYKLIIRWKSDRKYFLEKDFYWK
ncbi:cytochrome C oxidase Cbb3 [Blattabacterium cuenoti]|uniref:cytochrome C oxidase Cbb3 n=1 Tax=Blattabacterium cuenoti TaxID=1653831 RepID=UPI00163CBB8C|nr:cytochrome C oxidase Cbb3 [Blattabacterium cuenoti]